MVCLRGICSAWLVAGSLGLLRAADWTQYKYDSEHSGNAPAVHIADDIGLQAAIPLTDAIFTAPALADGRVYVLDGAGVLFCVDATTRDIVWQFRSPGGARNCNNYSSPAVVEEYVHFGTMAGEYFVLDARDGQRCAADRLWRTDVQLSGRRSRTVSTSRRWVPGLSRCLPRERSGGRGTTSARC